MRATFQLLGLSLLAIRLAAAPSDAAGVIARLLNTYDIIGIPEMHHSAENHVFLRQLVVDPRITSRIRDIAVEFGNARYQDVADRYVMGGEVPDSELQKIWRDTTVIMAWDSPLYREFFETVRSLNTTLPPDRRIRIVLGDPPIPWESVTTKEEYERWADRDHFFASVVEREIIARHHKALVVVGGVHLLNSRPQPKAIPEKRLSLSDLLRKRHPGLLFAFWHVTEPLAPPSVAPPVALVATDAAVAKRSFGDFAPKGVMVQKMVDGKPTWVPLTASDWPAIKDMTDGLIDYGRFVHRIEAPAETYRDEAYVKELRRRAAIMKEVYGMSFDEQIDDAVKGCP